MTRSGSRIIWLSLTLLTSGTVLAFDTEHHTDLTRKVLTEFGMNDMPARLFGMQGTDEDRARLEFFITTRTLAKTIPRRFLSPGNVFSPAWLRLFAVHPDQSGAPEPPGLTPPQCLTPP